MIDRFAAQRRNWEGLASDDPMWAILTTRERRGTWGRKEFMASGETAVAELLSLAEEQGVVIRRGRALDFGCGLGRLTLPLAQRFEEVLGVDVAMSMVEQAREFAAGHDNVTYMCNAEPHLGCLPSGGFDFICSLITLQHVPPVAAYAYMGEFMRLLAPGGVAVFQAPARYLGPRWKRVLRRLPHGLISLPWRWANRTRFYMEMNELPTDQVRKAVENGGGQVLRAVPDDFAGSCWESYKYFAGPGGLD